MYWIFLNFYITNSKISCGIHIYITTNAVLIIFRGEEATFCAEVCQWLFFFSTLFSSAGKNGLFSGVKQQ